MSIEKMKLALSLAESIGQNASSYWTEADIPTIKKLAVTLRQAIDQAQPMITKNEKGLTLHVGWDDLPAGTKLYADLSVQPLPDEETSELTNDPIAYLQSIWNLSEKP